MNRIINLFKRIIMRYELKHPEYTYPLYICTHIDTRNRYKNEKYKIPSDQPQCPVFKDNRCCGCCNLAPECDHCVNCGCFGYTYAHMGGNDKNYYLHKASCYYAEGYKLDKDGKLNWKSKGSVTRK